MNEGRDCGSFYLIGGEGDIGREVKGDKVTDRNILYFLLMVAFGCRNDTVDGMDPCGGVGGSPV